MTTIEINVSRTPKGYSASCDLLEGWVVAFTGDFGNFVDYVKESLAFYVECAKHDREPYPAFLDDEYHLAYKFDIGSLLSQYQSIFSFSALEHLTGINQRQLWHYANGYSKPRPKQREKIVSAFNRLGRELASISV